MKVGGVQVSPCEEFLVLPRGGEGKDIVFRAKAVAINDEFNKRIPEPVAPMLLGKGGQKTPDLKDEEYQKAMTRRGELRFAFLMLKSLEPSNIEWDEVDIDKPNTWTKWSEELTAGGISEVELNRIIGCVMAANSLDEAKIKEARDAFLRGQGE